MQRRDFHRLLAASAIGLTGPGAARAQDSFPSRPISMVVPFPPGGVADTVARPVAEAMARHLNQSVLVINRAGAGGAVGMAAVARAAADGYTVLMALSSLVVLPEAARIHNRPPPFEINQLMPIARMTADPTVLVVRADSPWRTYAEFIAHARAHPGRITFGSSGNHGTMHIPMEQLEAATNTFMLHVPYTGAGPAIVGLLGGQVDALASGPASIVGHVRAGRMRALAHWGDGRLALLPDVPSLRELGVNIRYLQWAGLFAPAGTPQPVVDRLREAARVATRDERTVQILTAAGTLFQYQDAAEFGAFVAADAATMRAVVQRIGRVE
jgi:tripartite-type tricarboxylate transporter receptor subunit TctC